VHDRLSRVSCSDAESIQRFDKNFSCHLQGE
jgi:hypothetical protein